MQTLCIWSDIAAYSGASFSTERHSHFLTQLCLGVDAPLRLRGRNGQWREYEAALVPSGISHETFKSPHRFILILFDPLTIGANLFAERVIVEGDPAIDVSDAVGAREIQSIAETLAKATQRSKQEILQILHWHKKAATERSIDARIAASIEKIASENASLAELAKSAGLSLSRFRHLFRDETGIAVSGYKVWTKTRKAIRLLGERPELAQAAYLGGFADQAHFSRIFRRSFGMSPSQFKNHETFQLKIFQE
jgi:AraC-like DNA-binding protein